LGRAVGIEIEECFCEVAALRLSQGGFDFANIPSPQQLPLTTGFPKSDDVISHRFDEGDRCGRYNTMEIPCRASRTYLS